jgi:N-acetylglucosaminyldiphosphoundecaprenol N-acetyl-beta-D-mannosaminyltransferase
VIEKENILGVNVAIVNQAELLDAIAHFAGKKQVANINYLNVYGSNLAHKDAEFRTVLNDSDIVFCDGFGIKLGAKILGKKLGARMSPPDWIDELFSLCEARSYKVFFVGDEEEVVSLFLAKVKSAFPKLDIVGWSHGFFNQSGAENEALVKRNNKSCADVIITGMGMPLQEKWAWQNRDSFDKGVFLATGAMFRWYSGYEKRCSKWISNHGFEWLARLVSNPKKLWRRYVVGNPFFLGRIMLERLKLKASVR